MIIQEQVSDSKILFDIKTDLEAGKKIAVNCTSITLTELIYQQGVNMGLKCAKYTGDINAISEQFG